MGKGLGGRNPSHLAGDGPLSSEPRRTRRNKVAPLCAWLGISYATTPPTEQTGHLDKKHIGHIYWCMCFLQKCWKEEPVLRPACWPAGRPGAGAQRLPVLREATGECMGAAGQPQAHSPLQPGPRSAGPRRVAEPAGVDHSLAMAKGFSTSMVPQSAMVTSFRGLSRLSVLVFSTFLTTSWGEQRCERNNSGHAHLPACPPTPVLRSPLPCPPALCRTPRACHPATVSSLW